MNKKKKKLLIKIYVITFIFIIVFFIIPLPYYSIVPGKTVSMGEVVTYSEKSGEQVSEREHFSAIYVNLYENPYAKPLGLTKNSFKVNVFFLILSKLNPHAELIKLPKEYNITSDEIKNYDYTLMNATQNKAITSALHYLNKTSFDGNISFGNLAGSSGSFITALEIIQQEGNSDLIRGRKIAGTGEISENGNIEEIGNVNIKIYTAKKSGAQIILLPEKNKNEVVDNLDMQIIYVTTLADAVEKLKE